MKGNEGERHEHEGSESASVSMYKDQKWGVRKAVAPPDPS